MNALTANACWQGTHPGGAADDSAGKLPAAGLEAALLLSLGTYCGAAECGCRRCCSAASACQPEFPVEAGIPTRDCSRGCTNRQFQGLIWACL